MSGQLRHLDQPVLSAAVAAGRRRRVAETWVWNRRDPDSDITPLIGATLAWWGLTSTQAKKVQKKSGKATFV